MVFILELDGNSLYSAHGRSYGNSSTPVRKEFVLLNPLFDLLIKEDDLVDPIQNLSYAFDRSNFQIFS